MQLFTQIFSWMLVKLKSVKKRGKKIFDHFMFISRNIYSLVWLGDYWQRVMDCYHDVITWWRNQVEIFSALLDICAGNSPASGEFPAQRPVTRSFEVFFDLCQINGWENNREAGDLRR